MSIFFTADTHFTLTDFYGVIDRDHRPFTSCKQMNKSIIRLWNKQATKNDLIYHLGDFVNYNSKETQSYKTCFAFARKIHAKIILILGNNEENLMRDQFDNDFEKFKKYVMSFGFKDVLQGGTMIEVKRENQPDAPATKLYLNHYPKNHQDGAVNLFGHIHGTVKVKTYGFNVGVDTNFMRLCPLSYVLRLIDDQYKCDENVYK